MINLDSFCKVIHYKREKQAYNHLNFIKKVLRSFDILKRRKESGKGGQNVNKVNTKVHLVLPLELLEGINENERNRLKSKLSSIINKDFCLFLDVDEERYQERNRQIALARIENRIIQALAIQKKRIKTKPTKASKERKLKLKKIRSEIKQSRGKIRQ